MNQSTPTRGDAWRRRTQAARAWFRRVRPFASGVLAAFAALLLYGVLVPGPQPLTARQVNEAVAQAMASATALPAFSARAYQAIQPSLVVIETQTENPDGETENGLGSGVVINFSGDILTSLHVVNGADGILITFADGTQSRGEIIAANPENDIAVVRAILPPDGLIPATLGNPHAMRVGDEAYVLGNPFGLYGSMSAGVISGFDRTFQPPGSSSSLSGLIQLDAAVNPGNSGGPLVNRDGQVIGIVVGIVNPTEDSFFIGISFAVPIDTAGGGAGMPPY